MSGRVAQKAPYAVNVESGKTYYWCSCGMSKNQPYCDRSHSGTEFSPVPISSSEAKTVYLCGCKQSKNAPFCDGTHQHL